MTEKQLAEFFVEQHVLQPSQADDVLSEVELNGKTVAQAMIDGGFIDEPSFYETIANGLGTEFLDLSQHEIAPADFTSHSQRPGAIARGPADWHERNRAAGGAGRSV